MKVEVVTAIKDDFAEGVGPSKVYHCFLSLDGMLFEIGKFYEGRFMLDGVSERLEQVLKFGKLCKDISIVNSCEVTIKVEDIDKDV